MAPLMAKGCTVLEKKHVLGLFLWKVNQLAFFRFQDPVIRHFLSLPPQRFLVNPRLPLPC